MRKNAQGPDLAGLAQQKNSALRRQRRRRNIARLDSRDVRHRFWVHEEHGRGGPQAIHEEVCRRLNSRETLLSVALRHRYATRRWEGFTWPDQFPSEECLSPGAKVLHVGKPLLKNPHPEEISLEELLHVLEWITIDTFAISSRRHSYLVLPSGSLGRSVVHPVLTEWTLQREQSALVDACLFGAPEEELPKVRPLIEKFQRLWLTEVLAPLPRPRGTERLTEYEVLLKELRHRRQAPRDRRRFLEQLAADRTIKINGHVYTLPFNWRKRGFFAPADIARLLLQKEWGRDPQAIKEEVARLRKERAIASAWAKYGAWLTHHRKQHHEIFSLVFRVLVG